MERTAARNVLDILGETPASLSARLGRALDEVQAQLSENFIADPGQDREPGYGMCPVFARDMALALGIHRACLEDPRGGELDDIPFNLHGSPDGRIDGLAGMLRIQAGTSGITSSLSLPIRDSAFEAFSVPDAGPPLTVLSSGLSACVVRPDALRMFHLEQAGYLGQEPQFDPRDPVKGINPELVLGAFELLCIAGDRDPANRDIDLELIEAMSVDYLASIRSFIASYGIAQLRADLGRIEIIEAGGERHEVHLPLDYNPVLAGFFRYAMDGRLAPFLILPGIERLVGIPMRRIAAVRLPWPLIALHGAHLGQELEPEDLEDEISQDQNEDVDEVLVIDGSMIPKM